MCHIMRQQLQELDENCPGHKTKQKKVGNHIPSLTRSFSAECYFLPFPQSVEISQVTHGLTQIYTHKNEERETIEMLFSSNHL